MHEIVAYESAENQEISELGRVYILDTGEEIPKSKIKSKSIWDSLEVDKKTILELTKRTEKSSEVSITPSRNKFSLEKGRKLCETITAKLSKDLRRKADVYFLADTTGSMSSAIDAVKGGINNINAALNATGNDLQFGVGNYRDFPKDAYAFRNQQSITSNSSIVINEVNNWDATGGFDWPEGQLFALDQLCSTSINWRPGSKRIIVWFGDAPAHDPICASVSGLPYDITESSVIAKLKAMNIAVNAISVGSNGLDMALLQVILAAVQMQEQQARLLE